MLSADKRLCFFDTANGEELASIATPPQAAMAFAFDPAGGWLTGGTRGAMLWPLRPESGRPELFRVGPPQLLVSGDGDRVKEDPISHDRPPIGVERLARWPGRPNPATAQALPAAPLQPLVSGVGNFEWRFSGASRDGKVLSIGDHASAILIHRDGTRPPISLGPQPGLGDTKVSPDGTWVATCTLWPEGPSSTVSIWDGRDGHLIAQLPLTNRVWCRMSPDGNWLATIEHSNSQLWKVGTWDKPERRFQGECLFSPDGKFMALADVVGCIRLVNTATREEVARLAGPEQGTYIPLCFTPDGTRLIASLGAVYVWDLRLIREQLKAMGLDWSQNDWPEFPAQVSDAPSHLRLTVDTGTPAREESGAASTQPQKPATRPNRPE
jgi:WD40 repeat protein